MTDTLDTSNTGDTASDTALFVPETSQVSAEEPVASVAASVPANAPANAPLRNSRPPSPTTSLEEQKTNSPQAKAPTQPLPSKTKKSARQRSPEPEEYSMHIAKRRVPGKHIERFWQPLETNHIEALDRILNMCISKATERYGGAKMDAAQRKLAHKWISQEPQSFKSRLRVTNVPDPATLGSKTTDPLTLDAVLQRKTFLETYLSAENKQLAELQRHYQDMEMVYKSDLKYLDEFKKTTATHAAKMNKHHTPLAPVSRESLSLRPRHPRKFDPNKDKETRALLDDVAKHLESITASAHQIANFNDRLEVVYNMLDMLD